LGKVRVEDFDGDLPLKGGIVAFQDEAHPTFSYHPDDLIPTNLFWNLHLSSPHPINR
jgi:hypothetical protein